MAPPKSKLTSSVLHRARSQQSLTYMVLALRTGDPLAELVAKAEGSDGRRPLPLAKFGTIEIVLRVGETKSEEGKGAR